MDFLWFYLPCPTKSSPLGGKEAENSDRALPGCLWLLKFNKLAFIMVMLSIHLNTCTSLAGFIEILRTVWTLSPNLVSLPQGLGRRKCTPDQKQHISRNFNLWACEYIPSNLDGFSNNQTSYVHKKAVVVSSFRRFPRCYDERWIASSQSCPKFLGNQPNGEFAVDTKVVSPHPRTGTPSLPEALDEAHDVIPAGVHEVSDPTPPP